MASDPCVAFAANARSRLREIDVELGRRDIHIETLRARMRVLQSEIDVAGRARKELERERRTVFAGIAPISSTPYEILAYILRLACEGEQPSPPHLYVDDDDEWMEESDPVPFIMTLSHVSRHFRHVALTTASLWSNIHVTLRGNTRGVAQARYRTRLMVERARSRQLDIKLVARNTWNTASHICSILMILFPVSRWQSLHLDCEANDVMDAVIRLFSQTATNLRRLRLESHWHHESDFPPTLFSGNAPLLSHLSLVGIPMGWDAPMLANLLELEIMFIDHEHQADIGEVLRILQLSPGLKRLVLLGGGPWIPRHEYDVEVPLESRNLPKVTLSSLEDFTLGELEADAISRLYGTGLSMPNLRSLTLDSWRDWQQPDYEDQLDIIKHKHGATLQRLKLIGIPVENPLDFARHFPSLKELELHEAYDFLQHLISRVIPPAPARDVPFPELECIKWSGHDVFPLCLFVQSRVSLGFGPSKVLLNSQRTSNHHAVEDMRALVPIEYFQGTERDKFVADRLDEYRRSDALLEVHDFFGAADDVELVAMDWDGVTFV